MLLKANHLVSSWWKITKARLTPLAMLVEIPPTREERGSCMAGRQDLTLAQTGFLPAYHLGRNDDSRRTTPLPIYVVNLAEIWFKLINSIKIMID